MAVQQNKKSRSRRDMRRSHDALSKPALSIEPTSGETHRRHHVSADGFYRGEVARRMVEDLRRHGSPMKESDLARYFAAERAEKDCGGAPLRQPDPLEDRPAPIPTARRCASASCPRAPPAARAARHRARPRHGAGPAAAQGSALKVASAGGNGAVICLPEMPSK